MLLRVRFLAAAVLLILLAIGWAVSALADGVTTEPTTAEIFARHEAAVGYSLSDGKMAPSIAYWTSAWKDDEGKSDSSAAVIHQAGLYYRVDQSYLGAVTTNGFNGRVFWTGSANDSVYPSTGYTRPFLVTQAVIQAEAFDASLNAEYKRSTGIVDIVRIHPLDGVAADVYFNQKTALIDRVVYDPDAYAMIVLYRDYRAEGPVTVAHTMESSGTVSTMTEFDWNAKFDVSEVAPPASHRYLWLPANGITTVPFDQHGGVVVDASVNGQGCHMVLDTGTSGIEFSEHLARIAGLKLPESDGFLKASPTVGMIDIGDLHLRDVLVDVVNDNYSGPYDGVIGGDVFSKTVVTMDFDKRTVTFVDPAIFYDDGARPSIGLALDGGLPQISVTANETVKFAAVLSTGALFEVNIDDNFIAAHDVADVSGFAHTGVMKKLAVGPYTIPNLRVDGISGPYVLFSIPLAPGYLGGSVLWAFNMTFDYPDRKLFMTPNKVNT